MITPFSSVPGLFPTLGALLWNSSGSINLQKSSQLQNQSGSPSSTGLTCPGRGTSSWFPGALHTTSAPASYLHPALLPTVLSGSPLQEVHPWFRFSSKDHIFFVSPGLTSSQALDLYVPLPLRGHLHADVRETCHLAFLKDKFWYPSKVVSSPCPPTNRAPTDTIGPEMSIHHKQQLTLLAK